MIAQQLALQINAHNVGLPVIQANGSTFNIVMGLVYTTIGAAALFFIIRGALQFITSGNDPSKVKQARDMIVYSAIVVGASTVVFVVIQFIAESLTK